MVIKRSAVKNMFRNPTDRTISLNIFLFAPVIPKKRHIGNDYSYGVLELIDALESMITKNTGSRRQKIIKKIIRNLKCLVSETEKLGTATNGK